MAGHRHRREPSVIHDGKLWEKSRGIEIGVLASVVGRVHYPSYPEFVDCGVTEDVRLGGADREAVIAVIGAVAVIRRSVAGGEEPWCSLGPVEDTVD